MDIATQIFWLIILSIVVASIAWTVTQEEIFGEWREYCKDRCEDCGSIWQRKFFYVFTCEYCFSHWTGLVILILTGFRLLIDDWRGYVLAFFALPWIANQMMSVYRRLRVGIKHENLLAEKVESNLEESQN
ncbi:MAG: hypothetical protein M3T96_09690 [Acidobacteriota bacterium]|nr:hypothetical protein [Acidobacteriota bacterium]